MTDNAIVTTQKLPESIFSYRALEEQRNELLQACKEVLTRVQKGNHPAMTETILKTAIEKAERDQ